MCVCVWRLCDCICFLFVCVEAVFICIAVFFPLNLCGGGIYLFIILLAECAYWVESVSRIKRGLF